MITIEEADRRMVTHLKSLYELVNNSCYNDKQKISMVSYMYNVGRHAMNIDKHIKRCSYKDIRYIMWIYWYSSNWKRLKWLVNRRKSELKLFNN